MHTHAVKPSVLLAKITYVHTRVYMALSMILQFNLKTMPNGELQNQALQSLEVPVDKIRHSHIASYLISDLNPSVPLEREHKQSQVELWIY